ncbi:MAG: recombinase family protein [Chloroflexi bacterium]|nr:recombinase family protein [Chloroflexota bacterium]
MRALQGKLPSGAGRKLYGYDYLCGRGVGEGVRYVNEAEAKWVRQMYNWLVEERLTVSSITRRLRALDVPTPGGSRFWLRQTVYRTLSNPAYFGKTYAFTKQYVEPKRRNKIDSKRLKTGIIVKPREEWIEVNGATPPIITEELFTAAQDILKRNKELSSRNAKRQYLLSGYIFCRRCNRRYNGYASKCEVKEKRYEQRYYRCGKSQSIASPERCDNKQLHAPSIEAAVWGQIERLLFKPEVILEELRRKEEEAAAAGQQRAYWQNEIHSLERQLISVEKQKDRAWKAFELTGDEERFKEDIAKCDENKKVLLEHKTRLELNMKTYEQSQADIEGIKKACDLVKSNLGDLNFLDKRLTLEALQIRVLVDGDKVDIEGAIPLNLGAFESSASR